MKRILRSLSDSTIVTWLSPCLCLHTGWSTFSHGCTECIQPWARRAAVLSRTRAPMTGMNTFQVSTSRATLRNLLRALLGGATNMLKPTEETYRARPSPEICRAENAVTVLRIMCIGDVILETLLAVELDRHEVSTFRFPQGTLRRVSGASMPTASFVTSVLFSKSCLDI